MACLDRGVRLTGGLTAGVRVEFIRQAAANGYADGQIAWVLDAWERTVQRARARHGIPAISDWRGRPGVPSQHHPPHADGRCACGRVRVRGDRRRARH